MAEVKYSVDKLNELVLDPMLSDNFLLVIANVPGVNLPAGADELLRIQCQSAVKPSLTIEPVPVTLYGHELNFAGRNTYGHDMSVQYMENWKGQITLTLEAWVNYCRDAKTQTGVLKQGGQTGYARNAHLHILNPMGTSVLVYKLYGLWPTTVPELSFTGESATALQVQTTFKLDYYELAENYGG